MKGVKIAWFSAGITSAVACKLSLDKYDDVEIYFIETGNHHSDNERFIKECEEWYNAPINIIKSNKYENVQDVILTKNFINSPNFAPCTNELKIDVRRDLHNRKNPKNHILGFEYNKHEMKRADNFLRRYPECNALFPLIEERLNKNECAGIVSSQGIELPTMYKMGYEHNNCIGCVKGGKGYWNKIRVDFPDVFNDFAKIEREIGASAINGTFLDELNPTSGNRQKEVMPNCGLFCSKKFL